MTSILEKSSLYKNMNDEYHPNFRAFGRKAIKLSANQKELLEELLPAFAIPFQSAPVKVDDYFEKDGPLHLEIGFGNGEYTDALAAVCPGHRIVACEIFLNGIASLLKRIIDEEGHKNIRIVQGNALLTLEKMFPENSFDFIHVNHPDPWPKKRHNKRRIIQTTTIPLFERALKTGGEVWLSTDAEEYYEWMEECFQTGEKLERIPATGRYLDTLKTEKLSTRFEEKGRRNGRPTQHLRYRKKA